MSLKPGGPRPVSARESEVRARFEECWAAAGAKTGAGKGEVRYGGRQLQALITALRKSERASAIGSFHTIIVDPDTGAEIHSQMCVLIFLSLSPSSSRCS